MKIVARGVARIGFGLRVDESANQPKTFGFGNYPKSVYESKS